MKNLQGIFDVYFEGKGWLYFVREPIKSSEQAISMTHELSNLERKSARVRIEDFGDFPRAEEDGFKYEVIRPTT